MGLSESDGGTKPKCFVPLLSPFISAKTVQAGKWPENPFTMKYRDYSRLRAFAEGPLSFCLLGCCGSPPDGYALQPTNDKEKAPMPKPFSSANARRNWFTITSLVSRDFKLKYRRSVLGVLWSVLNPLLMMIVLSVVFSTFFKFSIENYPLYVILGNVMFALMADSTSGAMNSIIESSSLIKKIRIEKLIFPVEKVIFQLVNFCISLIAVAAVMIFFQVMPHVSLAALPLLLLYVVLFSAGVGMALSALAVFFRDVCHLWGVIITAWTYATPLFYPVEILPDWAMPLMQYNPMYHYVSYFRDLILSGTVPGLQENLLCLGMALVAFAIGLLLFKKTEKKFILYV